MAFVDQFDLTKTPALQLHTMSSSQVLNGMNKDKSKTRDYTGTDCCIGAMLNNTSYYHNTTTSN